MALCESTIRCEYPDADVPEENVVTIIERCVAILKSPMADKEMKKFYLKYLVHLVGDIHQPMAYR